MVTVPLHSIEKPALPGPNLTVLLKNLSLLQTGEDNVTYTFLHEEAIHKFVHERQRITRYPSYHRQIPWGVIKTYPYYASLAYGNL